MRAKDALGRYGERLAARYLAQAGLTVVAQNWRCRNGEIDIVARDGDVLVFCEVKTRSGLAFGDPLEAVDTIKYLRLRRAAELYLAEHGPAPHGVRLDLIGVVLQRRGAARVEHVRGVC